MGDGAAACPRGYQEAFKNEEPRGWGPSASHSPPTMSTTLGETLGFASLSLSFPTSPMRAPF